MKALFSISVSLLLLLTGMHLSVATHYCGNQVAAVKWSFSGTTAECGMEKETATCPEGKTLESNCCHNQVSTCSVDQTYFSSKFACKEVKNINLSFSFLPSRILSIQKVPSLLVTDVSPPGPPLVHAVDLTDICVFRI